MIIIDPLKNRLFRNMQMGKAHPKHQALSGYATNEDVQFLTDEINKIITLNLLDDARKYIYIDLTPPFFRITNQQNIINLLNNFPYIRPIIMVSNLEFIEWAKQKQQEDNLPIVITTFNNDGYCSEIFGGSEIDKPFVQNIKEDLIGKNENNKQRSLADIRRRVTQRNLFRDLIKTNCIEFPCDDPEKIQKGQTISKVGKLYKVLKNGMMVSCYLNLKCLGMDIQFLLNAVYEIFLVIENYFITKEYQDNVDFDFIITTNNTALFIATLLQTIYEDKTLIAIDKLGPIPSLRLHSEELKSQLCNQNVILFEEVVGIGSEVDRAIMFLNHMHANITRTIALYDLEVGKPLLINDTVRYDALCTPKEELKYEYRSK